MSELTPEKIYKDYKDKIITKNLATKQLISLIENSESIKARIESIEIIGKLQLDSEEVFELLENLLISDSFEKVRIAAIKVLKEHFINKILSPMSWALEHEDSNISLTHIFETLMVITNNLEKEKSSDARETLLDELNKIVDNEYKVAFEIVYEKKDDLTIEDLAEILIHYFCLTFLKKTFWRIKYKLKDCLIVDLSFKFKGLTQIPIAIKYLHSLKRLKFRYNQIITIPEWINELKALELLNLNMNNINELPNTMGELESLRELYLWKNELKTLPEMIGNLKNLEKLILRINQLIELPRSIGELTSLIQLDIHDNNLVNIPESIGNLQTLEILNLSWNQLEFLPDSIGELTSLKVLDLGGNELTIIPSSIGALKSLEYLNLSRNELLELPESLMSLSSLKELYLGENRIKKLPKSLKKLEENGVKIYFDSYK